MPTSTLAERRSWPARVTVSIGFKDWPGAAPSELWNGDFEVLHRETDGLREQVEQLLDGQDVPFVIQERRGRTSWGGDSGEVVQVVLFVAKSAADGLIAAAMVKLFTSLFQRDTTRGQGKEPTATRLDRQGAIGLARWTVLVRYAACADSLDPMPRNDDDLVLVSESQSGTDEWIVGFRDVHGASYQVTIGLIDGIPSITKTERWSPPA